MSKIILNKPSHLFDSINDYNKIAATCRRKTLLSARGVAKLGTNEEQKDFAIKLLA